MMTIFTPTYNRAHLLERIYKNLCVQEYQNFEWLIIDDGSTDNTREIIENYKREGNDVSTTTSFPFCSLNTLSNIEKSHIARYQKFAKGVRYQYLIS